MNTPKHTPGPWTVEDYFVFSSNMLRIADCDCDDQDMPESEISANAHLIAAAPAMYLELKEGLVLLEASHHDMVDMYGIDSLQAKTVWECIESMRHTLAQAEGMV